MDLVKVSYFERIKVLEKALEYCANYGHPSIVSDVAKKALKKSEEIKCCFRRD
jgi:hypothetical protein